MEQPSSFDAFVLSLAEHDARLLDAQRAKVETNRLKHVTKAVHHRLRKAYYKRINALGLKPASVIGIEAKVLVFLSTHPDEALARLLVELQRLQAEAQQAAKRAASTRAGLSEARVRVEGLE